MSIANPQTDDERERAECWIVIARKPGGMWRPFGVCLGEDAKNAMFFSGPDREPDCEFAAINMETAHREPQPC